MANAAVAHKSARTEHGVLVKAKLSHKTKSAETTEMMTVTVKSMMVVLAKTVKSASVILVQKAPKTWANVAAGFKLVQIRCGDLAPKRCYPRPSYAMA